MVDWAIKMQTERQMQTQEVAFSATVELKEQSCKEYCQISFIILTSFLQNIQQFYSQTFSILNQFIISITDEMKHTYTTESGIKATIDIAYQKLQTKNPEFVSKTISDVCSHICFRSDEQQTKRMIRQLEQAYRDDVDELKRKIATVQTQRNQSRVQLQKMKQLYNESNLEKQKFIKQLERHELLSKIRQNQHDKSLQSAHDSFSLELNNALGVRSSAFELQIAKNHEAIAKLKLQINVLTTSQETLKNEIKGLKSAFEIQNRNWLQRQHSLEQKIQTNQRQMESQIQSKQRQIDTQIQTSKNKDLQISKLHDRINQIDGIRISMESHLQNLRQIDIPNLQKVVQQKLNQILELKGSVQYLESEINSLKQSIHKGNLHNTQLQGNISENLELILSLQQEIKILKQDKTKICQERVSRLIERQGQLDNLEIQILDLRKQNNELLAQLSGRNIVIIEKQRSIQQLSKQIENYRKIEVSMSEQINNLYLSKNQEARQFDNLVQKLKINFQQQISGALKAQKAILDGQLTNRQQIISALRNDLQNQRCKVDSLRIQINSHRSLLQTEVKNHVERQDKIKKVLLSRQVLISSNMRSEDIQRLVDLQKEENKFEQM